MRKQHIPRSSQAGVGCRLLGYEGSVSGPRTAGTQSHPGCCGSRIRRETSFVDPPPMRCVVEAVDNPPPAPPRSCGGDVQQLGFHRRFSRLRRKRTTLLAIEQAHNSLPEGEHSGAADTLGEGAAEAEVGRCLAPGVDRMLQTAECQEEHLRGLQRLG